MQEHTINHKIELDSRKKLTITGVISLDGYTEQYINLTLSSFRLKVLGSNIKITTYNKVSGQLIADGNFNEIKYLDKSTSVIKKLFK